MAIRLFVVLLLLLYPLLIYICWRVEFIELASFAIIAVAFLRIEGIRSEIRQKRSAMELQVGQDIPVDKKWQSQILYTVLANVLPVMLVASVGLVSLGQSNASILRWYPVVVSFGVLVVLILSLIYPPSVAERIERLIEPQLSARVVGYARCVTIIWCTFFALNLALSAYTALAVTWEAWLLYNGLIAYVLIALLFVIERLIRPHMMLHQKSDDQLM